MSAILNDLLEYARRQLNGHLQVARAQVDVKEICQAALEAATAAYPECPFKLHASVDKIA